MCTYWHIRKTPPHLVNGTDAAVSSSACLPFVYFHDLLKRQCLVLQLTQHKGIYLIILRASTLHKAKTFIAIIRVFWHFLVLRYGKDSSV